MNLQPLVKDKRIEDLYILSRFMYRIGKPIIKDEIYDRLERGLKSENILEDYISRTYDDDPIPYDLLKEFNLMEYIPSMGSNSPYAKFLDEEKSLSIRAVRDYEEAFVYFKAVRGEELIISLKGDGINSKSLYVKDVLEVSLSRARKGLGFDLTKNICKVIPTSIKTKQEQVKVFSESFAYNRALQYLRSKYGGDYKTEKSSAISMLRVAHDIEDYKYLESLAFYAEGLPNVEKHSDILEELKRQGFHVVPYVVLKPNSVPDNFDDFKEWLDKICTLFYEKTTVFPSDGLVVDVNRLDYEATVKNQYSDRNIALKLNQWSFKTYYGKVTEIVFEQRRVRMSCRVKIEPLKTSDGCDAKVVNIYNPKILIDNGIKVGSIVPFERNSGAINTLVRADKMKFNK